MRQRSVFKINLNNIEGNGEFPCPSCGAKISPDDESDLTYEIVDTKMRGDDSLEELVILCKKCGCKIRLVGFEMLGELGKMDSLEEPSEP